MKIKILHILNSLQIGGLENGVVNLINNLNDNRFEHAICCIDTSGPTAEKLGKPVEIFSLDKGKKRDYLLPFKIAKVIKKIQPDIVHTRNWSAIDGVIGAKLVGIKFVVHGEHGREAADPTGANIVRKKVRKVLNPWISRFITVSAELKNWLVYDIGIPEKKVMQIINGVDTNRFMPPQEKKLAKKEAGFNPDTHIIGIVGRLDPVKDHETLFRAFSILRNEKNREALKILVVGTGHMEKMLRGIAEDLNISENVVFAGDTKDVQRFYRCMDVYVLPSIAEGISNTVLEAMASGLPVLATMVGGSPELVDEGKTGFLFAAKDYMALSEKLFFYYNNPQILIAHGLNGRKMAEDRFSISKMIKDYEILYRSIGDHL